MVRKVEKINNLLLGIVFTLILSSLVGCASVNSLSLPDPNTSATHKMSAHETKRDYVLQAGDVINIKFFYNPELNEVLTIRPDGKISLQLIDEVVAAGLTSSELDGILTEKYSTKLRHADVVVIVKEFAGQQVYIGGEVNSAGLFPISGRLTALQAILQAGGYKETAELRSVVVLRNQGTQDPLFMTLNLQEDLTTYTSHNDIFLKPYDIVFVPKTKIAKLSQFVNQHIRELIPVTLSFGLMYNLNPEIEVK
ncbi:MAG: polysaccharide biosynthesis/export family protein [Desulfobacteraceae bacterium]|nr:polysaccharide biosynthesis/export family protein [Desulfobacteraceae bacterium]